MRVRVRAFVQCTPQCDHHSWPHGTAVCLQVAGVQYMAGQLQLLFNRSSRLNITPGGSDWCSKQQARYQQRLQQAQVCSWAPPNPAQWGSSSEEDAALCSVRQVLQCAGRAAEPQRYRLLARLVRWVGVGAAGSSTHCAVVRVAFWTAPNGSVVMSHHCVAW